MRRTELQHQNSNPCAEKFILGHNLVAIEPAGVDVRRLIWLVAWDCFWFVDLPVRRVFRVIQRHNPTVVECCQRHFLTVFSNSAAAIFVV